MRISSTKNGPLPGWTIQCSGDLGIAILGGQIAAQAFVHGQAPALSLHIFDIIAGGPHRVMSLAEGLTYMEALARHYSGASSQLNPTQPQENGGTLANHPSPND